MWREEKGKSFSEGKKLILFSDVEKGKGKSFSEGKKLILFSDVEKGKGKSFYEGKKLILFSFWWPRAISFVAESQRWNLSLVSLTAGV